MPSRAAAGFSARSKTGFCKKKAEGFRRRANSPRTQCEAQTFTAVHQ